MERRLFIIRHGKSSWDNEGLEDIDRPLAKRGIRNAGEMAERLLAKNQVPQLILSSPASRALNTALIMSRSWGIEAENLQITDALYMAYLSEIDQVIGGVPAEIKNLAIFGHNPSFTAYANKFLELPLDNLPTAGVVIVTLESENWGEIGRKQVKGTYVDYPKRK
ncbi:MAG: histidine phosphatase family protein [Bacteroidales bacterium]|nr:histidine phosphatase family protein [Bacteroidales bacterium]